MLPPVVASTALRVKPTLILKRDTFIHSFIKLHWALLPGRPQVEPFTRQRPCPVELLFGGEGTGNRQIRHLSNDEDYRSRERREGKWGQLRIISISDKVVTGGWHCRKASL